MFFERQVIDNEDDEQTEGFIGTVDYDVPESDDD